MNEKFKPELHAQSVHVCKYPIVRILQPVEIPVKIQELKKQGKGEGYHSIMPIEFIPPVDYMMKLALKANCIKVRVPTFGPGTGKVVDVKLCFEHSYEYCVTQPNCPRKDSLKLYMKQGLPQ